MSEIFPETPPVPAEPWRAAWMAFVDASGFEPSAVRDLASGDDLDPEWKTAWEAAAKAAIDTGAPAELRAAMAETHRMRAIVSNLLNLFGAPDGRRMRHASVTARTIDRYAGQAGVLAAALIRDRETAGEAAPDEAAALRELLDQATRAVMTKRWALTDSEKRIIAGFRQQAGLEAQ